MTLRLKSILILSATSILITVGLYYACRAVVMRGFESLEEDRTKVNVKTIQSAIQAQLADMDKTAADWAFWDDTYRFIIDRNPGYRESNLHPTQLKTISLDTMMLFNTSQQVVASISAEPRFEKGGVPKHIREAILSVPSLIKHKNNQSQTMGMLRTPKGIFLVVSRPILPGSTEGAIRGSLVMGRHLTKEEVKLVADRTHSQIVIRLFNDPKLPPDFRLARTAFQKNQSHPSVLDGVERRHAFALFRDLHGKPMMILRATFARTIYQQGLGSMHVLFLALLLSCVLLTVSTWVMLDRFVLRRVARLSKEIVSIGPSNVDFRVAEGGKDEISSLGKSINAMLAELGEAHKQIECANHALNKQNENLRDQEEHLTAALAEAERARELHGVASRRFEELFDHVPVPCFTLDEDLRILEFNNASERLWNLNTEQIYGRSIFDIMTVSYDDQSSAKSFFTAVLDGERIEDKRLRCRRSDGVELQISCNMFPLLGPEGHVVGVVNTFLDITNDIKQKELVQRQLLEIGEANLQLELQQQSLQELNEKLEALATTDGLTGLQNHRAFQGTLEQAFQLARREKTPLSVLLMDVDHFKQFNDEFGHVAGDEVLRQVAHILSETARGSDFVARYGGEEFVIVLPGTSVQGSMEAGERYRKAIESHSWKLRAVTVSVGAATLRGMYESKTELTNAADQALYESKRNGRNRVTHSERVVPHAA